MPSYLVLDSGVLGQVVHKNRLIRDSIFNYLAGRPEMTVVLPEIADFEVRRSLLRIGSLISLSLLDQFASEVKYLPIETSHMRRAAEVWAQCRREGKPFCDSKSLDGDCILIAQSLSLPGEVTVLTTNPSDIGRFVATETPI